MMRVVPPAEFTPRKAGFQSIQLDKVLIQSPIRQRVHGISGYPQAYQMRNFDENSMKTLTVPQFEGMSAVSESLRSKKERELADKANYEELERAFW